MPASAPSRPIRLALVGLKPDALDLIPLARGRGLEVTLMADPDASSRTHSLARVFRVPTARDLEQVVRSGCDVVVLPGEEAPQEPWCSAWANAGIRCLPQAEAWRLFSDPDSDLAFLLPASGTAMESAIPDPSPVRPEAPVASPGPASKPTGQDAPVQGVPPNMSQAQVEQEVLALAELGGPLFPSSLRAAATHLEQFVREQRSGLDASQALGMLWDEVRGELLGTAEILGEARVIPTPSMRRLSERAWAERRAMVLQEGPLVPGGDSPRRARAALALPLGELGLCCFEEAWLSTELNAGDRRKLAEAAERWAHELQASREEQRRVVATRIQERMGPVLFEFLPDLDGTGAWPTAPGKLGEILDADGVWIQTPEGRWSSAPGLDAGTAARTMEFLEVRPAEGAQAHAITAGRAVTAEGDALRTLGIASLVVCGRGEGAERVLLAAARTFASGKDEFQPEHLSALRKFSALASALGHAR